MVAKSGGRQQVQEVVSQSGFYSVNGFRLHVGPGGETRADLEMRWPTGAMQQVSQDRRRGGIDPYRRDAA
ncbi:MAG: UnbV [Acidobacteriota bacterium]|jgi:hypothetical protein